MASKRDEESSSDSKLSVLVVGAGVGGLMTALECWRSGFDVRILEKSPEQSTLGDSFNLGPSGMTTMHLYAELEQKRAEIVWDPLISFHGPTGELLKGPVELTEIHSGGIPRAPEHVIHRYKRPEFAGILLDQVIKGGMQVEYGRDVADYFDDIESDQAGVVLKDGSKIMADVVVAADGRRSKSWALVEGKPASARSSGRALFRCVIPIETARTDPLVAERFPMVNGRENMQWWSCDGFLAVASTTKDTIELVVDHPDTGTAEESWGTRVPVEKMLELSTSIPGWPEAATRLWKMAPGGKVVDWKLMWRDPQEKWVSPSGRVVQLGDAAHAFLPSSGNGGTQALEDAISLAQCLAIAGKSNVPNATRVHNLLRFERVSYLMALGVANQYVRDHKIGGGNNNVVYATFGMWILAHDPGQHAKDNFEPALEHLLKGTPFKNTNTPPNAVYRPWTIDSLRDELDKGEPTIVDGDWK